MEGLYRGPVAFGFDPPDGFWTNENAFESFVLSCFRQNGVDEDLSVYKGGGFELADHRDTAGSYGRADCVEDFVNDNLDLSEAEDSFIVDAYIIEDEARLVVELVSSDEDIAVLKHWQVSPYETMTLERVDARENGETFDFIYHIGNLNRTSVEEYKEGNMDNKMFNMILNESYADDCSKKSCNLKEGLSDVHSIPEAVKAGKAAINVIYSIMGAGAPEDLDTIDCFFDDADYCSEDEMKVYWTKEDINAAVSNIRHSIDDIDTKQLVNKIDKCVMFIAFEFNL